MDLTDREGEGRGISQRWFHGFRCELFGDNIIQQENNTISEGERLVEMSHLEHVQSVVFEGRLSGDVQWVFGHPKLKLKRHSFNFGNTYVQAIVDEITQEKYVI